MWHHDGGYVLTSTSHKIKHRIISLICTKRYHVDMNFLRFIPAAHQFFQSDEKISRARVSCDVKIRKIGQLFV